MHLLIHSRDRETAVTMAGLLAPYRYQAELSSSLDETVALARRLGPVELVLCLDDLATCEELAVRLREVSPDTRLLQLPQLKTTESPSGPQLETAGIIAEGADLMELVEGVLAAGGRVARPPAITVESLRTALVETVISFSLLLEQFDFVNGGNSRLVMEYATRIAQELGLSPTHTDEIAFAALLQDVGIVKSRAGRARKGAAEEDPTIIQGHPIRSANFIQRMKLPWRIRHIVLAHHEWYNGLGYPNGMRGREIPLGSRILAVANAFFSMISNRPSRTGMQKNEALEELRRLAGRQFDPEVVEVFVSQVRDKAYHDVGERRRRVTVLSEDRSFAVLVKIKFESSGWEATVELSGGDAMTALRKRAPDAVLLDSRLDDMTGFQLLHWMKQDPATTAIPVLVIASDDGEPHAFMAHDMGADDFILKPVRPADLVARINAIVRRHQRLSQAERTQIHDGEGLRGSLEEVCVPDLVEMIHEGRKTATVTLVSESGRGVLAFDGGSLVHARIDDLTGEEAFAALYTWTGGDFIIAHGAATAERTVNRRMDLLISEMAELRPTDPAAASAPLEASPEAAATEAVTVAPPLAAVDTVTMPAPELGTKHAETIPIARRGPVPVDPDSIETQTIDVATLPRPLRRDPRELIPAPLRTRPSEQPTECAPRPSPRTPVGVK